MSFYVLIDIYYYLDISPRRTGPLSIKVVFKFVDMSINPTTFPDFFSKGKPYEK